MTYRWIITQLDWELQYLDKIKRYISFNGGCCVTETTPLFQTSMVGSINICHLRGFVVIQT
jgi:hypothetical protein